MTPGPPGASFPRKIKPQESSVRLRRNQTPSRSYLWLRAARFNLGLLRPLPNTAANRMKHYKYKPRRRGI